MKKSFPRTGVCSSWHAHKHSSKLCLWDAGQGRAAAKQSKANETLAGPHLMIFFPSTHIYSYSYQSTATTGFISLARRDLICSTCELPISHDWNCLSHYQSTTLPVNFTEHFHFTWKKTTVNDIVSFVWHSFSFQSLPEQPRPAGTVVTYKCCFSLEKG